METLGMAGSASSGAGRDGDRARPRGDTNHADGKQPHPHYPPHMRVKEISNPKPARTHGAPRWGGRGWRHTRPHSHCWGAMQGSCSRSALRSGMGWKQQVHVTWLPCRLHT